MADPVAGAATEPGFRLNFLKLVVSDLERARAFYADAMGLESAGPDIEMPGLREALLARPGDRVTLILYHHTDGRAVEVGSAHGPVGFLTRDVDAALARLLAHGATPGRGPTDLPGMRVAFAFDPDGHEIELVQVKRAAPAAEEQAA